MTSKIREQILSEILDTVKTQGTFITPRKASEVEIFTEVKEVDLEDGSFVYNVELHSKDKGYIATSFEAITSLEAALMSLLLNKMLNGFTA